MNRQPYCRPPRWWQPKLCPTWIKFTRRYRWRRMRRQQRLVEIDAQGLQHVAQAVKAGKGVLITPNHSAHYDAEVLYVALDRIRQPAYFMTAWQIFDNQGGLAQRMLQWMGCFSVDREANDRQAFKQAVEVLCSEPHPLVIFPEGDVYHTTDRVTPFREGAAAIALSAAKRAERDIVVIPCGIKFWYVDDPTHELTELLERLENRLLLRPEPQQSLQQRILRLAEGALTLKELEYLGCTRSGVLHERVAYLLESILGKLEAEQEITGTNGTVPERAKTLRQRIIRKLDESQDKAAEADVPQLQRAMDDVFLVMQLYSYPGDYLVENPTIERMAETLDKLEEDIEGGYPTVRSRRRVAFQFGEPIQVQVDDDRRSGVAELTSKIQNEVQWLIDKLNAGALHQRPAETNV